ncbi:MULTISPECIES: hypothetical protein [unclassified Rathayibacter]|uniref:hypothetical protein n=1 Tax=unclassified Rathayibacter TaxID=2609250 RepID=UPI00188B368B|nr:MULTISPECIES: hypothetical protein [unclassified Rathayibacter]MBF4463342.1 hypothetical protein [Rathayibacter sp. VKM Ac-2879]MBF4504935.1 hypothetical protein [Rathayibacter sp. VKM Ac-2878]
MAIDSGTSPPRRRGLRALRELAWAVAAAVVSVVAAVSALGISPDTLGQRWRIGTDDQVLHYMLFSNATQVFSFDNNPALGFPDGFNAFFSAQFDVASAFAAGALALVIHDGILLLNVFYVLTFAGVAVTAYAFFRALTVRPWISALVAVAYSVAPYHFQRIAAGHAFLANYWAIPLIGILVLMAAGERTDPFRAWSLAAPSRAGRIVRGVLPATVLALLVATSGGYYYVFGVIVVGGVFLLATIARLVERGAWREILRTAVPVVALAVFVGVELVVLVQGFGERYEPYFESRGVAESELYAGKLVLLILPWLGSGLPQAEWLLTRYTNQTGFIQTTEAPGFSVLGTLGLILLILGSLVVLVSNGSRQHGAVGTFLRQPRFRLLATASYWTLLFYTVTGMGVIVALVAGPTIRAWARLSILLLLLCLGVIAVLLEQVTSRWGLRAILATAVAALVIVDQLVGVSRLVTLDPTADDEMRQFVTSADDLLPDACGVVQLPLKSFPDTGKIGNMSDYDEALPYLVTEHGDLEWSYGSVTGTYGWDVWGSVHDVPAFQQRVEETGACAVYVDTFGYTDNPQGWVPFVDAATGSSTPAVTSSSGRWLLFTRAG